MIRNISFYSIILFQFIYSIFFIKSDFYYIFNPYTLSILAIVFFYFSMQSDPIFKRFLPYFLFIVLIILLLILKSFIGEYNLNILQSLKKFQFVYGFLLLIPGIIIFRNILGIELMQNKNTYLRIIKYLLVFASVITSYEYLCVIFLNMSASEIFYLNDSFIEFNSKNSSGPLGYRPYGLLFYPQPNGIFTSFLLIIYLINSKKIDVYFTIGLIGLFISQSYSGILFFIIGFIFLGNFRFKLPLFILLFFFIFYLIILFSDNAYFYKLSPTYFKVLLFREGQLLRQINDLMNYNVFSLIFGMYDKGYSISHEWFYLSILREYGLIGLTILLFVLSKITYYALPLEMNNLKKIFFVMLFLLVNFHYPAACFITFQLLIIILCSINSSIKKNSLLYNR